jgi:vacuolar protein sorting-associated protein 18
MLLTCTLRAVAFMESTDLLKIEDILPFFPDFFVIDDFKDEICNALEGYSEHIERLKDDMDEATRSAEAIKRDIADLRNRFIVVDDGEKCESCGLQLLSRQFYVFPCQHAFHADCLITEVTRHLAPHILRRILHLQNQISKEAGLEDFPIAMLPPVQTEANAGAGSTTEANGAWTDTVGVATGRKLAVGGLNELRRLIMPDALVSVIGGGILGARGRDREKNPKETPSALTGSKKTRVEKLRQDLDDLLASSCVLCDLAVSSLDRPFVAEGEEEI